MNYENIISWVLQFFILSMMVIAIVNDRLLVALMALVAFLLTMIPMYLEKKYDISMPWIVEFMVAFALFMHIGGVVFRWYDQFWFWDVGLHFYGTALIALLGFMTVFTLHFTRKIKLTLKLIGIFSFVFAMAIGGLWEIGEYATDHILGTRSQPSLQDTMGDMILDCIAAIVVSLLGMWYVKTQPEKKIRKILFKL